LLIGLGACRSDPEPERRYGMTLDELLLQNARTCDSGFLYPQDLIDGLGRQLVEEVICMDDTYLEFYEPCEEPGCIWAHGPQPLAIRPEVVSALNDAALSVDDYISITAGYRDVAMQYYSRWYKENCRSGFAAAIPGSSNHQGGRAIDVRYYAFWNDILLDFGFEHPIPGDEPHYELVGDEQFREESAALQSLSVLAFQRLWNRNYPDDLIDEDGVYGATTKTALGNSPVEGFPEGACEPGSDLDPEPDAGTEDAGSSDIVEDFSDPDMGNDDPDDSTPDVDLEADVRQQHDVGVDSQPDTSRPLEDGGPSDAGSNDDENPPLKRFTTVGPAGLEGGCGVVPTSRSTGLWFVVLGCLVAIRRVRRRVES